MKKAINENERTATKKRRKASAAEICEKKRAAEAPLKTSTPSTPPTPSTKPKLGESTTAPPPPSSSLSLLEQMVLGLDTVPVVDRELAEAKGATKNSGRRGADCASEKKKAAQKRGRDEDAEEGGGEEQTATLTVSRGDLRRMTLWQKMASESEKSSSLVRCDNANKNTNKAVAAASSLGSCLWVPRKASSPSTVLTVEEASSSSSLPSPPSSLALPFDRFDIKGTRNVNELVLRHSTMTHSELKESLSPTLFLPPPPLPKPRRSNSSSGGGDGGAKKKNASNTPTKRNGDTQHQEHVDDASRDDMSTHCEVIYSLDRYISNAVKSLVHPLHNFLQMHHGLHNADEVQIMLMPREGPLAALEAEAKKEEENAIRARSVGKKCSSNSNSKHAKADGKGSSPSTTSPSFRRCYVATNNETLTPASLAAAVDGWGVAAVFQISEFILVSGEKGQHAEQKLLSHLEKEIILGGIQRRSGRAVMDGRGGSTHKAAGKPTANGRGDKSQHDHHHGAALKASMNRLLRDIASADEKALVIGERLPCAVCKLFSIRFEGMAVLLPSHGHLYASTMIGLPRQQETEVNAHGHQRRAEGEAAGTAKKEKSKRLTRVDSHHTGTAGMVAGDANYEGVQQLCRYLDDPQLAAKALLAEGRVLQR